jgi:hypothetical protein
VSQVRTDGQAQVETQIPTDQGRGQEGGMNAIEMEHLLDEATFQPFVITLLNDFAIAVNNPRKALVGLSMVVVSDNQRLLYNIPFHAIAHITYLGKELG